MCDNCHSEHSEESRTAQNTDPSHSLRMTKSKKGAFSHNLAVLAVFPFLKINLVKVGENCLYRFVNRNTIEFFELIFIRYQRN